jgi:hypothetical protein
MPLPSELFVYAPPHNTYAPFTGQVVDLLSDFDFDVRDSATGKLLSPLSLTGLSYAASRLCRYNGAIPISVREHGNLVGTMAKNAIRALSRRRKHNVDPRLAQAFVLRAGYHDFHEGLIGDITSPIKAILGPEWHDLERHVEERVMRAAFRVNGFDYDSLAASWEPWPGALGDLDKLAVDVEVAWASGNFEEWFKDHVRRESEVGSSIVTVVAVVPLTCPMGEDFTFDPTPYGFAAEYGTINSEEE